MKNKQLHQQIKGGGRLRGISGRNGMSVLARRVRGRLRLEAPVATKELWDAYMLSRSAMKKPERRVFWEDGTSTLLEDDDPPSSAK